MAQTTGCTDIEHFVPNADADDRAVSSCAAACGLTCGSARGCLGT